MFSECKEVCPTGPPAGLTTFSPALREEALTDLDPLELAPGVCETFRNLQGYSEELGTTREALLSMLCRGRILDLGSGYAIPAIEAELERGKGHPIGEVYSLNIRFGSHTYTNFFESEIRKQPELNTFFSRGEVKRVLPTVQSRTLGIDWHNLTAACRSSGLSFDTIISVCAFPFTSDLEVSFGPKPLNSQGPNLPQISIGPDSLTILNQILEVLNPGGTALLAAEFFHSAWEEAPEQEVEKLGSLCHKHNAGLTTGEGLEGNLVLRFDK